MYIIGPILLCLIIFFAFALGAEEDGLFDTVLDYKIATDGKRFKVQIKVNSLKGTSWRDHSIKWSTGYSYSYKTIYYSTRLEAELAIDKLKREEKDRIERKKQVRNTDKAENKGWKII